MQRSLARYLLLELAPVSAIANVVINALAAMLLFPAGQSVPLHGTTSIARDTAAASFLIGFFTLLTVTPGARAEARSGRVRGGGAHWLTWPARHPVLAAIAYGIACTILLGAPGISALEHAGVTAMPRGLFVFFKAAFAGVTGVVASMVAATLTIAAEAPVVDDPRWCRNPTLPAGVVYPFDYIDKGALAVTDNARGCSGTPTWQLVVQGTLDPAHVRTAWADVVMRYPSLTTKVQALNGAPPWATQYRYAHDPSFRLDQIFRVIDVGDDSDALATLVREEHNRPLDLFTEFPATLTMARTTAGCRLLFRQHHAIADGRAFIGLLVDFAAFLNAACAGRRPPQEALAPIGRRSEAEALALSGPRRAVEMLLGFGALTQAVVGSVVNPLAPLQQNRSNDYTGENGTVHWIVADTALEGWNAARRKWGVSLNSLLTGALFVATQRWHRERGQRVGRTQATLVMETRPRDGGFASFANHLAMISVEVRLDRLTEPAAIMRSVQQQAEAQRRTRAPIKRLLAEQQAVRPLPLIEMQRIIFESKHPASNLNFSNLIPLTFPTMSGDGWRVDEVLITTPVTPRTGIVLTAIRYGGKLIFNFNYKASAATRAETEALARIFDSTLAEVTGTAPASEWR